jgi:ABC-type cobalamin transport system permease subunit
MKSKFKHANKGIAVGASLLIVGAILFHNNETAMSIVGLTAFAACMAVTFILDEREYRARHSSSRRLD